MGCNSILWMTQGGGIEEERDKGKERVKERIREKERRG